jgi:hypothetical protein
MTEVFILCEEVDLGYHVICGYHDSERAEADCAQRNMRHAKELTTALQRGCGYDEAKAVTYVSQNRPRFFVEPLELHK